MEKKSALFGKVNKNSLKGLINYGIIVAFFAIITIAKGAGGLSNTLEGQLIPICSYIIMALSLNLVVGISGELSLGHAGFMSVGAFTGVIVAGAMKYNGVNANAPILTVVIILGAVFSVVVGILIVFPVLRLRGD